MPERDKFDELIESALADYAEPRAGLEQRMVARIAGHASRSSWRRWLWMAIAAPVVAAAMLLIYMSHLAPHSQAPSQLASTSAASSLGSVPTAPAPHVVQTSRSSRPIRHRDHAINEDPDNAVLRPKQNIFPAPQPLTAEEQALSRFASEASESDRKGLVEVQQRVDEPVNISAIRIAPLQSLEDKQN